MSNIIFGRKTLVQVTGKYDTTFNGDDLKIQFEVPFDTDLIPNETVVRIFNLSDTSLKRLGKDMQLVLQAGYTGSVGVLTKGKVTSVRSYWEGVDRIIEIKAIEGQDVTAKKAAKSITFAKKTTGETIIKKIVELLGLKISEMRLPKNHVYPKGYILSGNLTTHLKAVAKACGASVFYKRGALCIRSLNSAVNEYCLVSEETGMISQPEYFNDESGKGYKSSCLLQHKIVPGVLVRFKSKTSNGDYRVRKGKHTSDGAGEFKTEFEGI